MNPTVQAIITLLSQLGVFTIAAFIIQNIINRNSTKKVELYKAELIADLEKHKSHLVINVNKQGKLYERRLLVIDEMHKQLVEINRDMHSRLDKPTQMWNDDGEQSNGYYESQKLINDFKLLVENNLHYFKQYHADLLTNLKTEYDEVSFLMLITSGTWAESKIKKELPLMIYELENEFRKLMGVED